MENIETQIVEEQVPETEQPKEKKKRGPKGPSKYKDGGSHNDPNSPWYQPKCGKGNGDRKDAKSKKGPSISIKLSEYNELIIYRDRYLQMVNLVNKN